MASPSTARIRSPGIRPAASAGLPGCTSPTSAGVNGRPTVANSNASAIIAKTKLASGPATTIAMRCPTRFAGKLSGSGKALRSMVELVASASPCIFT